MGKSHGCILPVEHQSSCKYASETVKDPMSYMDSIKALRELV